MLDSKEETVNVWREKNRKSVFPHRGGLVPKSARRDSLCEQEIIDPSVQQLRSCGNFHMIKIGRTPKADLFKQAEGQRQDDYEASAPVISDLATILDDVHD